MKKLIVIAAVALFSLTAHAQIYLGGRLGVVASKNLTSFEVAPEIGYNLNENMAVGLFVGFEFDEWKQDQRDMDITINPYFRYYFLNVGPVRLFADAEGIVTFNNNRQWNIIEDKWSTNATSNTNWGVGISPGIALPLGDHFSVVSHLGYLGYKYGAFEFGLANNINLGLYYSF